MAITRSVTRSLFKKNQQQQQQQQPQKQPQTLNQIAIANHKIDFIDASIEWRKNKVKRESCCFEYIRV